MDLYNGSGHSLGGSNGSHQRTKRMRTSFKHHQLRTMKTYFTVNHNPDAKDLKQLSQKTGLAKRVLQVSVYSFIIFTSSFLFQLFFNLSRTLWNCNFISFMNVEESIEIVHFPPPPYQPYFQFFVLFTKNEWFNFDLHIRRPYHTRFQ